MSRDGPGLIERYFQILEAVAASHDGLTLTRIQTLTGLPKPTAHRLTRTLVETGALQADDAWYKTFRVGPRMWRLLHLGQSPDSVRAYAQMVADDLAAELHETCYIVRLGNRHIRSVARAAPDQGHRLHVLPGEVLPPHAASSAKAILAFQDDATLARCLPEPLEALTPRTTTSLPALREELAEVRARDYAVCDGEIDENIMAYAAPVHLAHAGVLYSIGVTGPRSRIAERPVEAWVTPLRAAAARLARMLEAAPAEPERA
ncbi:MAG: IclR family transcriptional regulator [Pseudomonadota bacterium]